MEDFLAAGGYIIANRYATSSMAHQAAKFTDEKEKKEFLKWLYELEYKVHRIPKENLVIYLHVPWRMGMELSSKKKVQKYLKGKEDIHEKDLTHRIESEKMYLELAKKYKHWKTIECVNEDKIIPIDAIHKKIVEIIGEKEIR
jgi:dTMP kinase